MARRYNALPWVIPEHCEGCGCCADACPQGILSMIETSKPGAMVPWLDQVDQCTGCGMCEAACAWSAICLTGFVKKARERFIKERPDKLSESLP